MTAVGGQFAVRKRIQGKVRRYMVDRGLLPDDGCLLLAVSGGPDSTALLLILARLAGALRLRLFVAHFDHGLRGEEAARQERDFVRRLCDDRGLPLFAGSGDVRGRARREGLSIEDAARRERYAFLASTAIELDLSAVATGHTAGDQAETVLLNLVRGAGLPGIAAMRPRAPWPFPGGQSLVVVRPLLCLTRNETLAYCRAEGVEPLQDE
ncbi:MAG TPA: tRNA lysidine(34) synthetase TilS, partial [Dehalococcoidia bacterium]|nr:tRNA lysidine(34) synthetase TilS [Dehalococcoidia bacterium]